MHIYEITFHVDLGKAIPAIDSLLNRINTDIANAGYDEQLKYHAPIKLELSVNRILTEEEEYKMKTILSAEMVKSMSEYDIRLVSFRRQSGNVSQSAS